MKMSEDTYWFRLLVAGYKRRWYGEFSALIADGEPSRPSPRSMMTLYAMEAEVNDVAEEVGGYIRWSCIFYDLFFVVLWERPKTSRNDHGRELTVPRVGCKSCKEFILFATIFATLVAKRPLGSCREGSDHEISYMIRITVHHVCTSSSADLQHGLQIGSNMPVPTENATIFATVITRSSHVMRHAPASLRLAFACFFR